MEGGESDLVAVWALLGPKPSDGANRGSIAQGREEESTPAHPVSFPRRPWGGIGATFQFSRDRLLFGREQNRPLCSLLR